MTSPTPSQPMTAEPFDFARELLCDSVVLEKSHPYTADMLRRAAAEIERLREAMKGATVIANISGSRIAELEGLLEGLVSQFRKTGCTCTFPDDVCCAFAKAELVLQSKGAA